MKWIDNSNISSEIPQVGSGGDRVYAKDLIPTSLFLIGLDKYGKGDWRSISRNVVVTRTPTQVASQAQKYYLRQQSMKKERKRSSIHDITTAVDTKMVPPQNSLQNQGGYQNFNFPM
ncbi:hypothetical protein KY285_007182 [Solanum tuberosum]|nr:hypothetical protein KY285_007182 [Solanum tuberosum]